jgi:hypothetical protein
MAIAAIFNHRLGAFARWPSGWRGAWRARAHCAEIEPVCEKRETEHATDSLRLSHFLSRSGVYVGRGCSSYRPIRIIFALLWLGSTPVLGVDATGQAPVDPSAVLSNPIVAQSIDSLSATRERPLFSPTRRPPARPAAAPPPLVRRADPAPPPSPPGVVLLGVVIGGDTARAFVRSEPPDKTLRVAIGDDIGGWKVSQIERHELVLSLGDRSATFKIFDSAKTTEPPPSVEPSPKPAQTQPPLQPQQTQPPLQAQQTQPSFQQRQARAQIRRAMRERQCPYRC